MEGGSGGSAGGAGGIAGGAGGGAELGFSMEAAAQLRDCREAEQTRGEKMWVHMWALWANWVYPLWPSYVMWADMWVCGSQRRRLAQRAGGVARAACIPSHSGRAGGCCLHARGDPAASREGPDSLPRRRPSCLS